MYKSLLTTIIFALAGLVAFGQADWKLSAEKDGIKVYTSNVPGSKIKAIKVECEINATESQLVSLLMDVNSSAEWVYHTKSCTLIKQVSPSDLYYYSEINLPWPAANRDFVAHLTVVQDPVTKVVTINGPAVQGFVPVKKRYCPRQQFQRSLDNCPAGFRQSKSGLYVAYRSRGKFTCLDGKYVRYRRAAPGVRKHEAGIAKARL